MVNPGKNEAGFSLIEIVVSLAILSLLSSIVVMNIMLLLDDRRSKAIFIQLSNAIEQARIESLHTHRTVHLSEIIATRFPELSEHVAIEDDILVMSNAACSAGTVQLTLQNQTNNYRIAAVTCAISSLG